MSQENVEVVRSVLAAIAVGDQERAVAFLDPQIVVDATRNVFKPAGGRPVVPHRATLSRTACGVGATPRLEGDSRAD